MVSSAKTGACCLVLCLISVICSSVVGILLSYGTLNGWTALEDSSTIQQCISSVTIDIAAPQPIEFTLIELFSWAIAVMFVIICCGACCLKDSDNLSGFICCCGCILVSAILGSAAIYMHICVYVLSLNNAFQNDTEITECFEYDLWKEVRKWALIGGGIAIALVISQCKGGAACLLIYSELTADTIKYTKTANKDNDNDNDIRIVTKKDNDASSNQGTAMEMAARVMLSAELIEQCGFSIASNLNKVILLALLKAVKPSGCTALRDAIQLGAAKMLALKYVLNKFGVVGHQFIYIVLTDGMDNRSNASLRDIQDLYRRLGQEIGDEFFKTFFIGIGLGCKEKQELQSIADLAGSSAELCHCNDVQLNDVFDRIKLSLGIHRRTALVTDGNNFVAAHQDQLFVQAERQKFLVLFDLDMSASMSGHRWDRLQKALSGFFNGLDDSDIIGCVLFNHKTVCITGEALNNATT